MAKPAVSRDAFRSLFALYVLKAYHDHKHDGEHRLLKLFGSSDDIPNHLLDLWSNFADVLGPESVGSILEQRVHEIADGKASYDHASAFLHVVLRELDGRNAIQSNTLRTDHLTASGAPLMPLVAASTGDMMKSEGRREMVCSCRLAEWKRPASTAQIQPCKTCPAPSCWAEARAAGKHRFADLTSICH